MKWIRSIRLVSTTAVLIASVFGNRVENDDFEDANAVTVDLLKEMFSGIQSTLQDQHESLKQQVKLQHEDLNQRIDILTRRQEDFILELHQGRGRRKWRATDSTPASVLRGEESVPTSSSLPSSLVERRSCIGLVEEFRHATEEFQILPFSDDLIAKVDELQQATGEARTGNADFFLDAKVKLQKYQAAITRLFNESRKATQSLFEVGQAGNQGGVLQPQTQNPLENLQNWVGEKVKTVMPNWRWVKDASKKTFTYFLEGRAYPLMEDARLKSGEHFASNLYQITMALVQQAFELIPKVFTNWAPTFGGLVKILGYWIESRAKIAFQDRHMALMKNLIGTLNSVYNAWLDESSDKIMDGILETVRSWLCRLSQGLGSLLSRLKPIFCDESPHAKGPDPEPEPEPIPGAKDMSKPSPEPIRWWKQEKVHPKDVKTKGRPLTRWFRKAVNSTRLTFANGWGMFKDKVHDTLNAIFHPLFLQVAVPIAANMRMELSKALTEFLINYMIELILVTPGVNIPLSFLGDDPAIAIVQGYGHTGLLPLIFESRYMEDLEQRIKMAYSQWLLDYKHFRTLANRWILSSFNRIAQLGAGAKGLKNASSEEDDQTCSGIEAPEICSEPESLPLEDVMSAKGLKRTRDGADPLHFYVTLHGKEKKVSVDQRDCNGVEECDGLFGAKGEGAFFVQSGCCDRDKSVCLGKSKCVYQESLPSNIEE